MTDPNALPAPMGVRAETGEACPPLSATDAQQIVSPGLADAAARAGAQTTLGPDGSVKKRNDLTQTGWGVIFASDADPAIAKQLQPLLDLRQAQVDKRRIPGMASLFKVFAGDDPNTGGVLPDTKNPDGSVVKQSARTWARLHGISLGAAVVPSVVPYYLLIVGSPERIPFEFQEKLKLQWLVGRLYFDDIEDYGRYARHVVAYETQAAQCNKSVAVWVTQNPGNAATMMLSSAVCESFRDCTDVPSNQPLGKACGFEMDFFSADSATQATKANLQQILRGKAENGMPSVIFTGSHGLEYTPPITDPVQQRNTQGALVTQEWVPKNPITPACRFAAEDVPTDHMLPGTVFFMFACFSAGCPALDSYYFNPDGTPKTLAPAPMIAKLPQALLSKGALAVIGHVDRAFQYGFVDLAGTPQMQALRTPLERLMQGCRAGAAADSFSSTWGSIAAVLQMPPDPGDPPPTVYDHIACDDARNYIVLGDPAVYLRVGDDPTMLCGGT
jgi:hypothetical protein